MSSLAATTSVLSKGWQSPPGCVTCKQTVPSVGQHVIHDSTIVDLVDRVLRHFYVLLQRYLAVCFVASMSCALRSRVVASQATFGKNSRDKAETAADLEKWPKATTVSKV